MKGRLNELFLFTIFHEGFRIIQLHHNFSFLQTGTVSNVPPGTVVDHTVTRRDYFDFFLVSQKCNEVWWFLKLNIISDFCFSISRMVWRLKEVPPEMSLETLKHHSVRLIWVTILHDLFFSGYCYPNALLGTPQWWRHDSWPG